MLNDNILVKKIKKENKTSSGLIIPQEKNYAEVEVILVPETFKAVSAGDIIYIPVYCGTELKVKDEEYLIITSKDIILKL